MTATRTKPRTHTEAAHGSLRVRRRDITDLSPRGRLVLSHLGRGQSVQHVSAQTGIHRMDIVRAGEWMKEIWGVSIPELREYCREQVGECDTPEQVETVLRGRKAVTAW